MVADGGAEGIEALLGIGTAGLWCLAVPYILLVAAWMPAAMPNMRTAAQAMGTTSAPARRRESPRRYSRRAANSSSNETGYLTHKVFRALGGVAFDNQARV